jgi:serine/threonine-protein kinase
VSRQRLVPVLIAAALAVLGVVAVVVFAVVVPKLDGALQPSPTGQMELPFGRLHLGAGNSGTGIAVDGAGAVYVADTGSGRVLKLPAGASEPTSLPFPGMDKPSGVAVDGAGAVYVIQGELQNSRIAKLAPGAPAPIELPTSTAIYGRLAVDPGGAVYVAGLKSVERLSGDRFEELPKPPGDIPQSVAADEEGAIYVLVQDNSRTTDRRDYHIQKLSPGATSYVDLTPAALHPTGALHMLAVDAKGAIYFTGVDQVSKLIPGEKSLVKVPVNGLMDPFGIAVGADGSVYVSDSVRSRVIKLPS